jgi:NAD(P)-dependent dehydrogenase (short-subunit alcohol dehydrogenase family)
MTNTDDSASKPLALVTGASRGLGRAAAIALAEAGWRVIAVARSQKALEDLDDAIVTRTGENAILVPADLKDLDGIDRLGGALYERFRKLDGLVGCAGVLGDLTPLFQARPRMMEEVMAVNVMANYRLIRAMDPLLRQSTSPRVVFVTSGAAQKNTAYWGPYAMSKAALEALALTYAAEVRITPIKVNLLSPGPVRTAMRNKAFPGEDPETLPTPEDVAPLFVELLSPACQRHGEIVRFERP